MLGDTKSRLIRSYFWSGEAKKKRIKYARTGANFEKTSAHLHIGVVQPQPVGFAQLGCVPQGFHGGQEVAAIFHAFVGRESQA